MRFLLTSVKNNRLYISNFNMKRFLIQVIFIIFLPTMCVLGVCENILRSIPNDYSYKHDWLIKNSNSIKILNFGSSHGYYDIRPEFFSKPAFNLAFVSQSLKYDKFLYEKYATACDSLEYVVLPISYFSFRSNLDKSKEWWRIKGYCIYMGCDYYGVNPKYNLEITSKEKKSQLKDAFLQQLNYRTCDTLGFCTNYKKEYRAQDWQSTGLTACTRHSKGKKENIKTNLQYLEWIIQDCQTRNIKVILLTTPTFHTYYDVLNQDQVIEREEICNNLVKKYSNVTFLNWLKHEQFDEDDFFDADHLNEYGAEKLTKMLDEYIK